MLLCTRNNNLLVSIVNLTLLYLWIAKFRKTIALSSHSISTQLRYLKTKNVGYTKLFGYNDDIYEDEKSYKDRDDFRQTRVFVQGIPDGVDWKQLKDHFAIAGVVVYASVSVDEVTGVSKGCGIIQYETVSMAKKAIRMMREYPIDGNKLYVREDVKVKASPTSGTRLISSSWRCANEEIDSILPLEKVQKITKLILERDKARQKRDYYTSDIIREDLLSKYGIHIDDKMKLWWYAVDNSVPTSVSNLKGEGRWSLKSWRQIPTTPENDLSVPCDLVFKLLKERDVVRTSRDFDTADALLQKIKLLPDKGLTLHIDDNKRTWRVWTNKPPPRKENLHAEQCVSLILKHEPDKIDGVKLLLKKFAGREHRILEKLKQKYEQN